MPFPCVSDDESLPPTPGSVVSPLSVVYGRGAGEMAEVIAGLAKDALQDVERAGSEEVVKKRLYSAARPSGEEFLEKIEMEAAKKFFMEQQPASMSMVVPPPVETAPPSPDPFKKIELTTAETFFTTQLNTDLGITTTATTKCTPTLPTFSHLESAMSSDDFIQKMMTDPDADIGELLKAATHSTATPPPPPPVPRLPELSSRQVTPMRAGPAKPLTSQQPPSSNVGERKPEGRVHRREPLETNSVAGTTSRRTSVVSAADSYATNCGGKEKGTLPVHVIQKVRQVVPVYMGVGVDGEDYAVPDQLEDDEPTEVVTATPPRSVVSSSQPAVTPVRMPIKIQLGPLVEEEERVRVKIDATEVAERNEISKTYCMSLTDVLTAGLLKTTRPVSSPSFSPPRHTHPILGTLMAPPLAPPTPLPPSPTSVKWVRTEQPAPEGGTVVKWMRETFPVNGGRY